MIHSDRRSLAQEESPDTAFHRRVQPLLKQYCLGCHSTQTRKGSLDLERFATIADIRKDLKPWQGMIEQLEAGEMPPKKKPQLTPDEKKQLLAWVHGFLDAEARSRSGDPGFLPLRLLSNAEYDATIRDLTGVELRPAREFPADGAAGEGFTNAAEALTDISPTLFDKYLTQRRKSRIMQCFCRRDSDFLLAKRVANGPTNVWCGFTSFTRTSLSTVACPSSPISLQRFGTARHSNQDQSIWMTWPALRN